MYCCFTYITFLFSFLKDLALFNLDCLKPHATTRYLCLRVKEHAL